MRDLSDLDDPRECDVRRKPPRAGSLYCSSACERIVEGSPADARPEPRAA